MMERANSFGSRPSTSSSSRLSLLHDDQSLPLSRPSTGYSRPGTSSGSRPGTATGSHISLSGPELLTSGTGTLQREADQDTLLRIMNGNKTKANDEFIMLAEKGDAAKISLLIEHGVNAMDFRGLNGFTPLHHACNRGHGSVVSVLINANFPVDVKNDAGETPLHLACYTGNLLIVEQLIDCGADIDCRNEYDETPLFYAARRSMPALVRLLLQRHANADLVDSNDEKAIDHAEDPRTLSMFDVKVCSEGGRTAAAKISHRSIQTIYSFLKAKEIGRASCVCGKWHRASESDDVWARVGKKRWELALQGSLGFGSVASLSFRPKSKPPKHNSSKNLKK